MLITLLSLSALQSEATCLFKYSYPGFGAYTPWYSTAPTNDFQTTCDTQKSYQNGETCFVKCQPGYFYGSNAQDAPITATCESSEFTNAAFIDANGCLGVWCTRPTTGIANMEFDESNQQSETFAVTLTCATGFVGSPTASVCTKTNQVYSITGSCEVACAAYVLGTGVVAGDTSPCSGTRLAQGSQCNVKCDVGYVPQTGIISCGSSASADDSTSGGLTCVACSTYATTEASLDSCSECSDSVCTTGVCAAGFHSFSGGSCSAKVCTCPNGTPTVFDGTGGTLCETDAAEDCSACAAGYTISAAAATGAQTCVADRTSDGASLTLASATIGATLLIL